jgi:hypothetical protein
MPKLAASTIPEFLAFLKMEHISKVTPTEKIVLPNGGLQEFTTSGLQE